MMYTKKNPRLSIDQYVMLISLRERKDKVERGTFQRLVRDWGVPQSTLATAVSRGIKAYDYRLWKQGVSP